MQSHEANLYTVQGYLCFDPTTQDSQNGTGLTGDKNRIHLDRQLASSPLELFTPVITVSLETMKIVNALLGLDV